MSERGYKDTLRMSYVQFFEHVFEVVTNQYFHLLRSQISQDDFDDIKSLAFMQALDHLSLFKTNNSLRTFMFTSIRNSFTLAINRYKVRNHPSLDDMAFKVSREEEEVELQIESPYSIDSFLATTKITKETFDSNRKLKIFCGYYILLGERYGTKTERFRQVGYN